MTPAITHLAETALYVDDLPRALDFYQRVLDLPLLRRDERFAVLRIAPAQVLLLFRRAASRAPTVLPGGTVPPHDGAGPLHVCLGIPAGQVTAWEQHLHQHGIALESRVTWPSGAISLYLRDPDGHALELATPGVFDAPS